MNLSYWLIKCLLLWNLFPLKLWRSAIFLFLILVQFLNFILLFDVNILCHALLLSRVKVHLVDNAFAPNKAKVLLECLSSNIEQQEPESENQGYELVEGNWVNNDVVPELVLLQADGQQVMIYSRQSWIDRMYFNIFQLHSLEASLLLASHAIHLVFTLQKRGAKHPIMVLRDLFFFDFLFN